MLNGKPQKATRKAGKTIRFFRKQSWEEQQELLKSSGIFLYRTSKYSTPETDPVYGEIPEELSEVQPDRDGEVDALDAAPDGACKQEQRRRWWWWWCGMVGKQTKARRAPLYGGSLALAISMSLRYGKKTLSAGRSRLRSLALRVGYSSDSIVYAFSAPVQSTRGGRMKL